MMTSVAMLVFSSLLTVSLFFMTKTPHELGRQKKYKEIEITLRTLRDNKSDSEIQQEVEMLKMQVGNKMDTEPNIHKLQKLNKKNVFVVWVVYVFFSNLAGINIMASYLPEIFSNNNLPESVLVICYGVSEMIFSFLQMLIADKLGR